MTITLTLSGPDAEKALNELYNSVDYEKLDVRVDVVESDAPLAGDEPPDKARQ